MRRLIILAWLILITFSLTAAKPPDPPDDRLPVDPPRPPIVAAWIQRNRGVSGPLSVIIAPRINAYHELSPHSYTIERDGSLTTNVPVADAVLMDFARLNGIKIIPTVSSGWENAPRVYQILRDPKLRAAHLNAILKIARLPNVDGIDLDYENFPPESQTLFTEFVTALADALHRDGKILSVTVPPKISDNDPCVLCRFADYHALGLVADRIRIMGYEYRGNSGGPGAIAPVWWLRQVAKYAITQIPRGRVQLAIHLYGYDWGGKETPALWWNEVIALKEKWGGEIRAAANDPRGIVGESVMTYARPSAALRCSRHDPDCVPPGRERHTVYFVDARYVAAVWEIISDYKLGGIVLWRPGGEDPAIWNVFKNE
ncbi:MAG: hypothetical protein HY327_13340 [Chloroflexi bacterium]|nr:hypothetical protein [Chloroflexota bacterium]